MSRRLVLLAALALGLLLPPAAARADFGLAPGSLQVQDLDAAGQPEVRAGAHPDKLITSFALNTLPDGGADGNLKDVVIDLPAGMAGDPGAVPPCPRTAFASNACPPEAQVGVMHAAFIGFPPFDFPIYAVAPRKDELAELGFFALLFPVRMTIGLRAGGDYGTQISLDDLPASVPLSAGTVELWGVPADHQAGTSIPRKPFLSNPTRCDGSPIELSLHVDSWQQPGQPVGASTPAGGPLTACDQLPFAPAVGVSLDTPAADSPSGLSVDLTLPQNDVPDGVVTSQVDGFSATLPPGLTLSPGVGDGLVACDDAQLAIGTTAAPSCPPASKIGSVRLTTPLQAAPLDGDIWFGRPLADERFRLFITVDGPGVVLKLRGALRPDPETGQLFVALDGLPQVPFSELRLHFKDGPRAPLATPPACGPGAATVAVAPARGGPAAELFAQVEVANGPGGAPCPATAPFAPSFDAGSTPPHGGGASSFSLTVRRADGQQALDRLSATLPPGLSARLAGVPRCPTAQAVRAACPAASRIGTAGVEAGAGPQPLPLTGAAYLTGPHAGAPFGVALVLHAQVGPIDLGTVTVLSTLRLDPDDARVTIATDPLPRMLAGVPLRLRTLALDIDRAGFMRNPTSCTTTRIAATLTSLDLAAAQRTARYALGGCRTLRFAPSVSLALGPPGELVRGGHPTLSIRLSTGTSRAAVRTARVALPPLLGLDPAALPTLCPRARARRDACPRSSAVGSARVRTPLLPHALSGPVDVVMPARGTQPELWAMLAGGGVRLRVRSTTSAPAGKPVTASFVDLPDIPLSSFALTLRGGSGGLLKLSREPCATGRPLRLAAVASLRGQNGALRRASVRVGAQPRCAR
jgi:hypothetical protein